MQTPWQVHTAIAPKEEHELPQQAAAVLKPWVRMFVRRGDPWCAPRIITRKLCQRVAFAVAVAISTVPRIVHVAVPRRLVFLQCTCEKAHGFVLIHLAEAVPCSPLGQLQTTKQWTCWLMQSC